MAKPYSMDLRERAVAAVLREGRSRHKIGGALRGRAKHGDQLGAAVSRDWQRSARPRWAGTNPRRSPASTLTFWPGASGKAHSL